MFLPHYSIELSNVRISGTPNSRQNILRVSPTLYLLLIGYIFAKYCLFAKTRAYMLPSSDFVRTSSVSHDYVPFNVFLWNLRSAL